MYFQSENDDLETSFGFLDGLSSSRLLFEFYRFYSSSLRYSDGSMITWGNVDEKKKIVKITRDGCFTTPLSGNYTFDLELTGPTNFTSNGYTSKLAVYVGEEKVEELDQFDAYRSNSRNYLCHFKRTWQMSLNKDDEVSIRSAGHYPAFGRYGSEKLTWSGSYVGPI